jgi:hypothetical protein
MRLFLILSIILISNNLHSQTCKKIILSFPQKYHDYSYEDLSSSMVSSTLNRQKREYLQKLIRPLYNENTSINFVIYLKENKGVYSAKFKQSDNENVILIDKVEKFKKDIFIIYFDKTSLFLDLSNNVAIDLKEGTKFNLENSICEF